MTELVSIASAVITFFGIVITAFLVIKQIILQRRLTYITSLLQDDEIMHWYKIFLKDLRFIYETLGIFPDLQIDEEHIAGVFSTEAASIKLEFLTTYIRHVLRGDQRLGIKYPELKERV